MAAKTSILILSYFFPPCNKVGGRRWAKFGKYLLRKGHEVHVISVDVPFSGACPWEKDIIAYKHHVLRLPYIEHRPFYRINKAPATIAGKLRYRLSWYSEKFFPPRAGGDKQDVSLRYGPSLLGKASALISAKKISTIVITGGPFHWCYAAMQLKKQYPHLTVLLDLRDFWTGGDSYKALNEKDRDLEDRKEAFCVGQADTITTPAERIAVFLRHKYPSAKDKIVVLPHAYDADELGQARVSPKEKDCVLTFAYGGILYANMEPAISRLIGVLKKLIDTGTQVKLDLYTFDTSYQHLFERAGIKAAVSYHDPIPPHELFSVLSTRDYVLQLRAGESQEEHFKSTKFYELIALRKPIIYFGPEGDVSAFISEHRLGYSGNMDLDALCRALTDNKQTGLVPDRSFDVSAYEYSRVTDVLEHYLSPNSASA